MDAAFCSWQPQRRRLEHCLQLVAPTFQAAVAVWKPLSVSLGTKRVGKIKAEVAGEYPFVLWGPEGSQKPEAQAKAEAAGKLSESGVADGEW